jgi:hypothetical protein
VNEQLRTVYQRRFQGKLDLSVTTPEFKYNIFRLAKCDLSLFHRNQVTCVLHGSKKFNGYIFKEPQDPSAEMTRTVEVLRDDELELRLFQVC